MKKDLARFIQMETYRGLGETISCIGKSMTKAAKYGMNLDTPEMIEALSFVDFAKLHNLRVSTYNKFDDPELDREIRFTTPDREEKVIKFRLNKRVGRIDFKSLEKSKVKLKDLLEILYLDPEVNAIFLELMKEPKKLVFSNCKTTQKAKSTISYFYNDIAGSFNCKLFAETDPKGYVLKLGNKGSILIDRVFECGKYLEIPGYSDVRPTTKEEKANYEVELMNKYYYRL